MLNRKFELGFIRIQMSGLEIKEYLELLGSYKNKKITSKKVKDAVKKISEINKEIEKNLIICNKEVPSLNSVKNEDFIDMDLLRDIHNDIIKLSETVEKTHSLVEVFNSGEDILVADVVKRL